MRTHEENPWRRLRALGTAWKLKWSGDMEAGEYGYTDHGTQTIVLREGMSFEERRSTIAHEVHHAYRGPVPDHKTMAEELLVDRCAARLLLPSMKDVADCLAWAGGDYDDAATELWVDTWLLEVRLSALHARERNYMERRYGDIYVVTHADDLPAEP
jgi:hypothetical protein